MKNGHVRAAAAPTAIPDFVFMPAQSYGSTNDSEKAAVATKINVTATAKPPFHKALLALPLPVRGPSVTFVVTY